MTRATGMLGLSGPTMQPSVTRQLKHAIETDFQDQATEPTGEEIRQLLLNRAPKFGNDDDRYRVGMLKTATVEIFHRGKRVASHVRSHRPHRPSTIAEHMPSSHRRYRDWTHDRIRREAARIG